MADASSGVSGSDSSQNAQNAANQAAETAAAERAAADKAAAEATAAAVDTVQAAAVDLSISPAAISQLSAISVDTTPSLSSLQTLGGVPTAATYADVAQATPTAAAVTEYNAWAATFSITPNDPATVETAPLSAFSFNLGLNHVGDLNASIEARMGIAPAQVTFAGKVSYTDGITGYSLSGVAGPFGGVADPNYGITATTQTELDFGKLDLSVNVNANTDGFSNGTFSANVSAPLSQGWNGLAGVSVDVDRNGVNAVKGTVGVHYDADGTSIGLNGNGRVDTRTGEVSGGIRLGIDRKF